jgi:hypothetical protein
MTMTDVVVLPIDPDELTRVRRAGVDAFGRPAEQFVADDDGAPLRCCLTVSRPGERLLLIGHAPLAAPRAWQEVGPVFVHAQPCPGPVGGQTPPWFDESPRVLRAYDASGRMLYDHNRLVGAGEGVDAALRAIFAAQEVAEVHVRNVIAQCFVARAVRGDTRPTPTPCREPTGE